MFTSWAVNLFKSPFLQGWQIWTYTEPAAFLQAHKCTLSWLQVWKAKYYNWTGCLRIKTDAHFLFLPALYAQWRTKVHSWRILGQTFSISSPRHLICSVPEIWLTYHYHTSFIWSSIINCHSNKHDTEGLVIKTRSSDGWQAVWWTFLQQSVLNNWSRF